MKAIIGKLERKLTLKTESNPYIESQVRMYDEEHEIGVNAVVENSETWEHGVGSFCTLRTEKGSNEIAGSLYLSQAIDWEEEAV